jgi:hypothetical protein
VWNLLNTTVGGNRWHRDYGSGDQAEAGSGAELGAVIKQHLHTEAYAEQRLAARCDFPDYAGQSLPLEFRHAIGKGSDAWQNNASRRENRLWFAGHRDCRATVLQSPAHAQQITHTVIDYGIFGASHKS